MKSDHAYHLEYLPFLTCYEPDLINMLCRKAAVTRNLKKGEYLFKQGDMSDLLFVVREGNFKLVWINEAGKETILHLSGRGEFLGTTFAGHNSIHLSSAIALEASRVCVLTRSNLEEAIRESPDIALKIICNLGNRLHYLTHQVTEFHIGSTYKRVLNLLARLALEHGEPCFMGTRITLRLTQQDIANFVGASRAMVAQVLKQLTLENCIAREKNHFVLTRQALTYENLNRNAPA